MLRHCADKFQLFADFSALVTPLVQVSAKASPFCNSSYFYLPPIFTALDRRRWPQGSLTWNNWRIVTDMCALPAHCALCTVFTS